MGIGEGRRIILTVLKRPRFGAFPAIALHPVGSMRDVWFPGMLLSLTVLLPRRPGGS